MNGPAQQSRNLDLLRALAVCLVFGAHLAVYLTKTPDPRDGIPQTFWQAQIDDIGRIGVLLFFVHTALVLLFSLDRSGPRMISSFYIRRFFRIYPLSAACILLALALREPFMPAATFAWPNFRDVVANLLLIQNLTYSKDVISVLWTLPREVQMYLMLPFVYLILRRFGSAPLVLVMWCGFFAAVPYAQVLSCVPCFFGGVLAYQLSKEKTFRIPAFWWPVALVALVMLHLWFRQKVIDDYRSDYVLCMILGGLAPNFVDLTAAGLARVCHVVAKYSYGIYLFHYVAIWVAFVKLAFLPAMLQWAALAVLMVAVPWIAFHALEDPMIRFGKRAAERWSRVNFGQTAAARIPV